MSAIRLLTSLMHLLGIGVASYAMVRLSNDPVGWVNRFTPWVWSPFVLLAIVAARARSPQVRLGTLLTSVAATLVGGWAYLDVLGSSDGQSAFVVIFVPAIQFALCVLGLGASWFAARRARAASGALVP